MPMLRVISKGEAGFDPANVQSWLDYETGGAIVVCGRIVDCDFMGVTVEPGAGTHWRVPVFSHDGHQRGFGPAGPGRVMFKVLRPGVCTDGLRTGDFGPCEFECPNDIPVGSVFSASIPQGMRIAANSIFVERNPDGSVSKGERADY